MRSDTTGRPPRPALMIGLWLASCAVAVTYVLIPLDW
jgi:hypothetical protein